MKTKKFKNLIISDREPKEGDIMVCIQKNNFCYGQISDPVTHLQVKHKTLDTKNWKVVENMEERKQELVDAVIEDLKNSFKYGDYTVLDELLKKLPLKTLIQSLPEKSWKKFPEIYINK
ncbi:MAG: hypothetical protein KatS3mg035_0998 [Bacteroidia bacterium]|nr:MAG: hypothetical protein KatS3mg035_0998 [Bacteroidia bacterium]